MNKIEILRKINRNLKFAPLSDFIGLEIPLKISKPGEIIAEIENLVKHHLNVDIKAYNADNIMGTIAKYGMLDLNFEVRQYIEYGKVGGIQILRDNGWADQDSSDEYRNEGLEFLQDMCRDLDENKNYLKVYATITGPRQDWAKEKRYLMKQMLNGEPINPLPEDEYQIFKIKDMCYTNYSGIWLWKNFYL